MKSNEIEFNFTRHNFSYTLPLLNVDLDFLKDRRCEVIGCMRQLAKRTADINIATKKGVAEFSLANELVKYYFYALITIEEKQEILSSGKVENTNNYAPYTGKLSQGRK